MNSNILGAAFAFIIFTSIFCENTHPPAENSTKTVEDAPDLSAASPDETENITGFAVVMDKDGYVNVRDDAGKDVIIKDTLHNGQIVYCLEGENGWMAVDYHLEEKNGGNGYIHRSRLKRLSDFDKVNRASISDTSVLFQSGAINLSMTTKRFNPKTHKLQYDKQQSIIAVDGEQAWGNDNRMPETEYDIARLTWNGKDINLPTKNLFEPTLDYAKVTIDPKNQIVYVIAENSDGAGSYAVVWVIEKEKPIRQIITIPF